MNCKQARTDIALLVGQDLDEPSQQQLQRHLAACPHCREHRHELSACLATLHSTTANSQRPFSLWPRIEAQLVRRAAAWQGHRFNGWIPAVAVAASWAVLLIFLQNPPSSSEHYLDGSPVTHTSAGPVIDLPDERLTLPAASDWQDPRALDEQNFWRPQRERLKRTVSNEF